MHQYAVAREFFTLSPVGLFKSTPMQSKSKYIIIGAGLSGLTTAWRLKQQGESDFVILEGRDRVGGRIETANEIDFGATWFGEQHTYLNQLLEVLQLDKFEQYRKGKSQLIYQSMAPPHYFESESEGPPNYRIANGSTALIAALSHHVSKQVRLNTSVSDIQNKGETLTVVTNNGNFEANKVIVTLPPKLATGLQYEPTLPTVVTQAMKQTHTWMSNAVKVGMNFTAPFWRAKGLSGTLISQISPVIELYDHCNHAENHFALMGFVNEGLRNTSAKERKERILAYLEKCLGSEVRDYLSYEEKDWSLDRYTSCTNLNSVYMSPQYGNALFQDFYLGNKLLFSGTETSPHFGGYLEGAIYSGLSAAEKITN